MVGIVLDYEYAVVVVDAHTREPLGHFAFEVDQFLVGRERFLALVHVLLVHLDVAYGLEVIGGGCSGRGGGVLGIAAFFLEREE